MNASNQDPEMAVMTAREQFKLVRRLPRLEWVAA
jgi:1,2-phenylacetyl-CoA epoxidase PaaB subunit